MQRGRNFVHHCIRRKLLHHTSRIPKCKTSKTSKGKIHNSNTRLGVEHSSVGREHKERYSNIHEHWCRRVRTESTCLSGETCTSWVEPRLTCSAYSTALWRMDGWLQIFRVKSRYPRPRNQVLGKKKKRLHNWRIHDIGCTPRESGGRYEGGTALQCQIAANRWSAGVVHLKYVA